MSPALSGGADLSRREQTGQKLALWVTCAHALLLPSFNTLNLLKVGQPIWTAYLYGSFILLPGVYFLGLFVSRNDKVRRLDGFELFVLFVLFWGFINTCRFGGDMIDIFGKVMRLVLVLGAYKFGRQLLEPEFAPQFLTSFGKAAAWGVGVAVAVVYAVGVFGPLHAVISIFSECLLATLAIVGMRHSQRRWLVLGGLILLLILSGKRGNYVASAVMLAYGLILGLRTGNLTIERLRKPFGVAIFALMALFVGFSSDAAHDALKGLPYNMRSRLDVFLGNSSAAEMTANRSEEVDLAIRQLGYEPGGFITGLGLGAALPGVVGRSADTIHIQPLFMTFLLGFVGLGLYLWAVFGSIRPFIFPKLGWDNTDITMSLIAVGMMGTTLTSATFLSTPILWIAMGYMTRRGSELAAA